MIPEHSVLKYVDFSDGFLGTIQIFFFVFEGLRIAFPVFKKCLFS